MRKSAKLSGATLSLVQIQPIAPCMSKQKDRVVHEENYIDFLQKRLASVNYKNNVGLEEYEKSAAKLKKAKLVLKMLK